jgi:hypothetical protein
MGCIVVLKKDIVQLRIALEKEKPSGEGGLSVVAGDGFEPSTFG